MATFADGPSFMMARPVHSALLAVDLWKERGLQRSCDKKVTGQVFVGAKAVVSGHSPMSSTAQSTARKGVCIMVPASAACDQREIVNASC